MKLAIRPRHIFLTPALQDQIFRRVRFALGRLTAAITAVDIFIADINGPKGGPDKRCRVRVRGKGMGIILIEHVGEDTLATVAHAAERAERAVLRALSRSRTIARDVAA